MNSFNSASVRSLLASRYERSCCIVLFFQVEAYDDCIRFITAAIYPSTVRKARHLTHGATHGVPKRLKSEIAAHRSEELIEGERILGWVGYLGEESSARDWFLGYCGRKVRDGGGRETRVVLSCGNSKEEQAQGQRLKHQAGAGARRSWR